MRRPVIENVSDTALMVAMYRAIESERPDALFSDPLAAKLAGERGRKIAAGVPHRFGPWSVAVRTVVIDELIEGAIARGADSVLNLGAGLDTRPYRMRLPKALRWIEVDYPQMMESKETALASETPHCSVERVKIDLAQAAARRSFLDEVDAKSKRALVLTEGVVPYLSVDDAGALADDLRRTKAVREWIVDYFSPETIRYRKRAKLDFENAPFKFDPKDWFAFFEEHGWRPTEKRFLAAEGERLGRPVPLPPIMRALATLRGIFLSRERREAMRRFAGYFRMEPV
jgi:methyltransferase (TIGR00027 family)